MRTPSESRGARSRNVIALCTLAVLVVVAPEMLGGVYPSGMLAIASISLIAMLPLCGGAERDSLPWSPLLAMLSVALAWTLLQLVPLPFGLTRALAPEAAHELARTHQLLGLGPPSSCPLSRDPAATREEAIKAIAILATFWCSYTLARRGFRPMIHHTVAASSVLLALVGIAHAQLNATRVFGWYQPVYVHKPPVLAPILEINTLGGVLMMCLPLLMALVLVERDRPRRTALLLATTLVLACTFMTRSRGAIAALALGVLGFALIALRRWQGGGAPRVDLRQKLERLFVPLALGFVLAATIYGWNGETLREFRGGSWDKLVLIAAAARFALDHAWLGVGRGAFGSSFAGLPGTNRFDHAENFVVQWAAEWGVPFALILFATLTLTVFNALRRARSLDRIGALVGLIAFGLQNFVDLGFEIVGASVLAVALLGAAITDRQERRDSRWKSRNGSRLLGARVFVAGSAVLLVAFATPALRNHRVSLERELTQLSDGRDHAAFQRVLAQAMLAHPSEAAYALLAATEAIARGDRAAGKWINRGMELRPQWTAPHLQAAQWLWNAGHLPQARIELAVAADLDRDASRGLLCHMARYDALAAVAALHGRNRQFLLDVTAHCLGAAGSAAHAIDRLMLAEFPSALHPQLREGEYLLGRRDPEGALHAAELAHRVEPPPQTASNALRVRALTELGRTAEAIALLKQTARTAVDPGPLLGLEAELHVAQGDHQGMLDALDRMRGAAAGRALAMAEIFRFQGKLEARFGNLPAALQAYKQAYSISADTQSLTAIAETAAQTGDRPRALWAYRELCEHSGSDRAACAKRDELLATSRNLELPVRAAQPIQR